VSTSRILIDQIFSLQWCRENVVIPTHSSQRSTSGRELITIAIGNYSYLATIGDFIQSRISDAGYDCQVVQRPIEEIQALLDKAASERIFDSEGLDTYTFDDDQILEALRAAEEDKSSSDFQFDFDDSEEHELQDNVADLSTEMLGSQIQRAAAQILISACRSNVSDIHLEPRENEYKIRVRRDGVMQPYVQMPRSAGIKLTA